MNEQDRQRSIKLVIRRSDCQPDEFDFETAIRLAVEAKMDVLILGYHGEWMVQGGENLYLLGVSRELIPIPSKYYQTDEPKPSAMKKRNAVNFDRLDAIALENFCQISDEGGKRVYTCRTISLCQRVYEAIKSRTESDAIVIRLGVGSHYDQFHPNALSKVWVEPNVKKGEADGGTDHDRIA